MLNYGIRDVSALIRRSPTGRRRISLQHSAFSLVEVSGLKPLTSRTGALPTELNPRSEG